MHLGIEICLRTRIGFYIYDQKQVKGIEIKASKVFVQISFLYISSKLLAVYRKYSKQKVFKQNLWILSHAEQIIRRWYFLQHMPVALWRRIETPGITFSFMTRLVTKNALANECQWHRGIPQHAFCEDMPRKAIDIHLLRHTIPKPRVMKTGSQANRPRDFRKRESKRTVPFDSLRAMRQTETSPVTHDISCEKRYW